MLLKSNIKTRVIKMNIIIVSTIVGGLVEAFTISKKLNKLDK